MTDETKNTEKRSLTEDDLRRNISRRRFLKIGGSLAIGGVIMAYAGGGLWKLFTHPEQLFHGRAGQKNEPLVAEDGSFVSPYRRTFGFMVDDDIQALEVSAGSIFVATQNNISVYGLSGELQTAFSVASDLRDMTVYNEQLYLLYANRVEVYDRQGAMTQQWEACSDNSDYCSLTVFDGGVFVTDASNKNICKYNLDGTLSRFIKSPDGFIVPSYSFGIMNMDGVVYCSNPGRHTVEKYSSDGEFLASFGKSGAEAGAFSGCCNPVILTQANNGEILTSEKGIPRISCYSADGRFRSVLLDSKALGGGHDAYDVRVMADKLIVACGTKVSVFQYKKNQNEETACGQCTEPCPLKTNI